MGIIDPPREIVLLAIIHQNIPNETMEEVNKFLHFPRYPFSFLRLSEIYKIMVSLQENSAKDSQGFLKLSNKEA